eukprot:TRINITY_DN47881_c0_g1_i1.p1 TRINITY_DN47881_c0_g1~~TRINITY_DN47881_c0_g1_i1.p1  ORF type:complete len:129 (-),score=23.67 TRINITY_DN47881_c0_g1_i1:135-521(-)
MAAATTTATLATSTTAVASMHGRSSASQLQSKFVLTQRISFRSLPASRNEKKSVAARALLGGDDSKKEKRKFITKDQEPEEYWQSESEREGKGPMSTVLPYIAIFGFATPFIILAIAFAQGWIDVPAR